MSEPTAQSAVSNTKRRRLRFGMRGLIGVVLLLGLIFGWLARMRREAVEQEAVVAELTRDRVGVISREPTLLCLVLTKLRGSRNILPETPAAFAKWLSPGWFSHPISFNASRLAEDGVPRVVERLQRLGTVHEVRFHGGSADGVKLFFIGEVRYGELGSERETCTFKVYPAWETSASALPSGHP